MNQGSEQKILIIDDEQYIRQLLTDVLESYGYVVICASGSMDGLLKAQADKPDLIVSDINMPQMDGFEMLRRLQADEVTKNIPLIFLTAKSMVQDKVRGLREGALDYICKPFSNEELLARIDLRLQTKQTNDDSNGEPDTEVSGSLSVFSIVDLAQLVAMKQLTGCLEIVLEQEHGREASVTFNQGAIVSVKCGYKKGLEAFRKLMDQKEGIFRFTVSEQEFTREIDLSTSELIFEATRQLDECNRLQESLPDFSIKLTTVADHSLNFELDETDKKILSCFDAKPAITEVLDCSPLDELKTLQVLKRLLSKGVLVPCEEPAITPSESIPEKIGPKQNLLDTQQITERLRTYTAKKENFCHIIVLSVIEAAVKTFVNRICDYFPHADIEAMCHDSGSQYKKIQFDRDIALCLHFATGYQQFTMLAKEMKGTIDGAIVFVETRQTLEQLHFRTFLTKLADEFRLPHQICTIGRTYRRDGVEDLPLKDLITSSPDIPYCNLQDEKSTLELFTAFLNKIFGH